MTKETKNLKKSNLRHNEYYDQQPVFDNLYARSQKGENFHNLMEAITNEQNIMLAYRNIKRNKITDYPLVQT